MKRLGLIAATAGVVLLFTPPVLVGAAPSSNNTERSCNERLSAVRVHGPAALVARNSWVLCRLMFEKI